jgi:hypothetical protein
VRAAERENCRVLNSATLVDDQARSFRADVDERGSKLFVVLS